MNIFSVDKDKTLALVREMLNHPLAKVEMSREEREGPVVNGTLTVELSERLNVTISAPHPPKP